MGGFDGLNPVFAGRLRQMIKAAAAEGRTIGIGSGQRSIQEQERLRIKNGCPDIYKSPASSCRVPTAIPGRSNHNHGLAADLTGDKAWANANGARFGLHFPVNGEDWHVELIDDEEAKGAVGPAQQQGAIGFDMEWQSPKRTPQDELTYRLDTVMSMLTQESPSADTPEEMVSQGQLAQDVTTIAGGEPSTRQVAASGAEPSGGGGGGGDVKGIVRNLASEMGWGDDQWGALETLVQKESSWNPKADNPTSTAYGLFQFLDSTWKNYGGKTDDPAGQARAGLKYIRDRYGSPAAALAFHKKNNWY